MFRHASDSGRSSSPETDTGSRGVSVLGIVVPAASQSGSDAFLSDHQYAVSTDG